MSRRPDPAVQEIVVFLVNCAHEMMNDPVLVITMQNKQYNSVVTVSGIIIMGKA